MNSIRFFINGKHLVAVACVIGAVVVAATGNDGWGWFLLVAVLFF